MAFAQQLQEVRRAAGLTQEEFAAELQVSRQSVSKWESGRGYPEIEKILYICNRFGVTPNALFAQEVPGASDGPLAAAPDTPPYPGGAAGQVAAWLPLRLSRQPVAEEQGRHRRRRCRRRGAEPAHRPVSERRHQ